MEISDAKRTEFIAKFKEFLHQKYEKKLAKAANEGYPLVIDFGLLDRFRPEMGELLLNEPDVFFEVAEEAVGQIDLPGPVKIRVMGLTEPVNIRDLRARHIGKFLCTEGIVRRSTDIRPEIIETIWECPECQEKIRMPVKWNFIARPFRCSNPNCKNTKGFKQVEKKMIDLRRVVIEEPFELTEGERPAQVGVWLTEDLVSSENARLTEAGCRLKITGILRDIPKKSASSTGLDFYLDANHIEPTEIGWEKVEISKKDEEEIKKLAKDPLIYKKLVASIAPSLYGMNEIKEAIALQLFGGVPRLQKDKTKIRGDIHILLIGDPASGKSQLMKLVPTITPRGKYVSGKGVTTAGLTATVTKDETMGGWVLEAGALVLAHKGLLAVDEFEKMSKEDQVAMHEGLEHGAVSIAKASIVATLPAQTSVLAGGNPRFSRFDPMQSISKQITIPDTLLTRFDLKFILKDVPDTETDKRVVDHILKSREGEDYPDAVPVIPSEMLRKYIAYAKTNCKPEPTKEANRIFKSFYIKTRKQAAGGDAPIPMTLRQFESLMRLGEASAKIQLSNIVRPEDAKRAIKLMSFSLRQLGVTEEGAIDIDKAEGAITTSAERGRIRIVLNIINELSLKSKEIRISDIQAAAEKQGISDWEEIMDRLKREGMLFEPNPGYVQKV